MTNNTIPNVPRELLAELQEHIDCHRDAVLWGKVCDLLSAPSPANHIEDVRAMVADPSPAGVDGLGNTAKLLLPALRQYMHNDGSGLLAGYDLETTQAIIDGLRGEVERLQRAEKNDAIAYKAALERQDELRTERDQQAQRIGELEGFIQALLLAGNPLSNSAYNLAQHEGHALTKYECELLSSLRKQWDAALSAGKEGE